jgi:hypothetical protein
VSTSRSKRTRRHARLAVLLGVTVFLIAQGVAALLVEQWFPRWKEARLCACTEHFRARARMGETVVFLGTSRTQYGIKTQPLEPHLCTNLGRPVSVLNFAIPGATSLTLQRVWRHLPNDGTPPTIAVVEIVPATLDETCPRTDVSLGETPAGEMDFADIQETKKLDEAPRHPLLDNVLARTFPWYGHRLVITGRLMPELQPTAGRRVPADFGDIDTDPPAGERGAALQLAHDRYYNRLSNFHLGSRHLQDLADLLRDIRAANVPVILLVPPEGPLYRSWYAPGAWQEIEQALRDLAEHAGCTFVTTREWMPEESFFDSHHLTVEGGKQFSERLGREVLTPALQASH